MEFVDGPTLQDKINEQGALELKEVLRIGIQLAAGLAAAHKQGLVHRDVKPSNILLENSIERVVITDFGLARAVDDKTLTQAGGIAGTPQFMSPEQAQGRPIDARTDLFSMGSVLYTLCTGQSPFAADSAVAVLRRVCDDAQAPIRNANSEIPEWVCDVISKLLEKEPAARFDAAEEVSELFEQYLAHIQAPDASAHPPQIPRSVNRRSRGATSHWKQWWFVGTIAALLLIATVSYMQLPRSAPGPQRSVPPDPRTDGGAIELSPSDIGAQLFLPPPSIKPVESGADVALLAGVERWIKVPNANGDGTTIIDGSKIVVTQLARIIHEALRIGESCVLELLM